MTTPALVRAGELNFPLFLHVLGAFALTGALFVASAYLFAARRDGSIELLRGGFRTLLIGALPAYVVMRVGAQWIASKEGVEDSDAAWITMGYMSSEGGLLLFIVATALAGMGVRRARQTEGASGAGTAGVTVATGLLAALVLVYFVMIVVMATKPS